MDQTHFPLRQAATSYLMYLCDQNVAAACRFSGKVDNSLTGPFFELGRDGSEKSRSTRIHGMEVELDFEGEHIRDLLTWTQRALRGDHVEKGVICAAAIRVVDNPPRDGILRSLADHVCQAVFDWACFDGSSARLEGVVGSYQMAAGALRVEERLNNLGR